MSEIKLPETIEEAMELATKVLVTDNSNFENTRRLIKSAFTNNNTLDSIDIIKQRLLLIDATYSTQMGRRLYGIEELAKAIMKNSVTKEEPDKINDKIFINKLEEYKQLVILKDKKWKSHSIEKLFEKEYGIRKNGEDQAGVARSLISKYCYYISDYNFPIDDSLLRNNTNSILKRFKNQKNNLQVNPKEDIFVKELIKICKSDGRNYNFDQFDHLVWAYGKIKNGSLSIFVDLKKYKQIVNYFGIKEKQTEQKKNRKEGISQAIKEIKDKNPEKEDEDIAVKIEATKIIKKQQFTVDSADKIIKNSLKDSKNLEYLETIIPRDLYTFIRFSLNC